MSSCSALWIRQKISSHRRQDKSQQEDALCLNKDDAPVLALAAADELHAPLDDGTVRVELVRAAELRQATLSHGPLHPPRGELLLRPEVDVRVDEAVGVVSA